VFGLAGVIEFGAISADRFQRDPANHTTGSGFWLKACLWLASFRQKKFWHLRAIDADALTGA